MLKSPFIRLFFIPVSLLAVFTCAAAMGFNPYTDPQAGLAGTPESTRKPPKKTPRPKESQAAQFFPTASYIPDTGGLNVILGRPAADSIALSLYSETGRQVVIKYGTFSGRLTSQVAPVDLQAKTPRIIEISGLTADTAYYYEITGDGLGGEEHSFHTARASGSQFTFTIDADPHNRDPRFNGELYSNTLTGILNDHPDFHIDLGDTFMTEKIRPQSNVEMESTFQDMRPFFGIIGADVPLFLVSGNHEGELGWLLNGKEQDLAVMSAQYRRQYFANPVPGGYYSGSKTIDPLLGDVQDGYYSWKWGDALFIVLDPFWYTASKPSSDDLNSNWNWTLGKEQYFWLKSTLETTPARFKFVFIHHLVGGSRDARGGIEFASLFEWGGNNADGTFGFDDFRPGWEKPIHQLLVENHVSAVFHGHDHVYVKQDLDGIVYQEVPQPDVAESSSHLASEYGYKNGTIKDGSGYIRVKVQDGLATVEFIHESIDKSGGSTSEIEDSYTIRSD